MRRFLHVPVLAGLALAAATPAHAELVFFTTGRSLSVKSHRTDGESLVLELRGGGEVAFDPSLVARIEPDEVPYPEEPADRVNLDSTDAADDTLLAAGLTPELERYIDAV